MAFIVITGNNRKQFDSIREALEYRTIDSRLFELDAFGNLILLREEHINDYLKKEPIKKTVNKHETAVMNQNQQSEHQSPFPNRDESLNKELQKIEQDELDRSKKIGPQKRSKPVGITLILLYVFLALILLFFVYIILRPFFTTFFTSYTDFKV